MNLYDSANFNNVHGISQTKIYIYIVVAFN